MKRHHTRTSDDSSLECLQYQFAHLVHEQMPELGSAMHASGVGPETYLLEWLTSMFAVVMPDAVTFHMMDFVLANADVHTMGVIHVCKRGGMRGGLFLVELLNP